MNLKHLYNQFSWDYGYLRLEGYSIPQIAWLYIRDFFNFRLRIVCLVKGHDLIDLDPGDPENGPHPNVYCVRCGRG